MTIYIIKNEQKEEVGAYTVYERAKQLSKDLQSVTLDQYSIEEIEVKVSDSESA